LGIPELDRLKAALAYNNRYAGWCTVAVFVGLVVEYTILLWLKRKELSLWETVLTIVAGIAIAGGVFGEYHFGSRAADAAIELQTISERQVAELDAENQKSRLRADALELQIIGRHITLEQRKKMIEILGPRHGNKITIGYVTDSGTDSFRYSSELGEVFCDANWVVFRPVELISTDLPVQGFLLEFKPDSLSAKQLANLARKALAVTGYDAIPKKPAHGFQLGGHVPVCHSEPSSSTPAWYPTDIEILVGGR
jgi:hypothetical protein